MEMSNSEILELQIKILERLSVNNDNKDKNEFSKSLVNDLSTNLKSITIAIDSLIVEHDVIISTIEGKIGVPQISESGRARLPKYRNKLKEVILKNRGELFNAKVSKFKYYTFWPVFFLGLIGGTLGVYNFFLEKESDQITKEEFNEKIKVIENQHVKDSLYFNELFSGKKKLNVK